MKRKPLLVVNGMPFSKLAIPKFEVTNSTRVNRCGRGHE